MTVGEVCNREVVISRPDASLMEAVRLMKTHHVGDVVVVEDRTSRRIPIGILTDRDVALAVVDRFTRLPYLRVEEVMSHGLVTATEDENVYDVVKRMRAHGIRRLPVVNATGGLEGILTFDDVIELLSEQLADLSTLLATEQKRERFGSPSAGPSADVS